MPYVRPLVAWLIRILLPLLGDYLKHGFRQDFQGLKPLQKILLAAGFYALLVYAFIATLGALN